jgi:hypothetical protein
VIDQVEIAPIAPRQTPETRHFLTPPTLPAETGRLMVDGWTIQVVGDAVFITCAGEVMTQTRTGGLNQKEIVVRPDPPATPNARATELVK